MKNISTISKIFAVLSLITLSIWLGVYISRLFLVYQLFEGPDLILKSFISDQNIDGILTAMMPSIVTHFTAFILMIVSFILFYSTSKIKLRYNGWLFIILIAVLITLPFEIYLMLIDYNFIKLVYSGSFDASQIIDLLRDRIKDLSSFSLVEIFTYLSFYYFIVFQPLSKKEK